MTYFSGTILPLNPVKGTSAFGTILPLNCLNGHRYLAVFEILWQKGACGGLW
jgi:hypothetical protein